MKVQNVPLGEKEYLNPEEAISHWNLSRRKFYRLLKKEGHSFMAYFGTRKLILRVEFEKYLRNNPGAKEDLANGKARTGKKRLEA